MDLKLLWVIQLAPIVAFLLIQLLPKNLKRIAPAVGMGFAALAALASLRLFWAHQNGAGLPIQFERLWLSVNESYSLTVGFLIDPINLLMITLVTTIAFFVQVFSFYYMAEDESRARYFGFLSFFSFSMTGLVLSNNLLQTFLFWELVGLTSYLLIGFWYQKPSAATAARKAFVINRLADLGFYLGIVLLFLSFGHLNFTLLTAENLKLAFSPHMLTLLGLLVFMGVMGKSAQFPFHVWLPDAMEGPTPVSALIHSATMVAAGVFLLVRAFGLFSASAHTLDVILVIGTLTALTSAAIATVQRDIKKILAYSTVSQLGLMVMGIGAHAPVAGMFHLSTHAYFKSLLFLTSGAFIHQCHTNDIFEIGKKGGKKDLLSMAALALGLASLCGIFPFAGFFSKDMILESLREHSLFFYGAAILVSFLTVYYSFRLFFVIALSKEESHGKHHGHEAHHESSLLKFCKALPLVSLALISLFVGFSGTSFMGSRLLHWLGGEETHLNIEILVTTSILIVTAALIAFVQFRDPKKALEKLSKPSGLRSVLENKFYLDDAYAFMVKQVGLRLGAVLDWFDRTVINGLMVNQSAFSVMRLGRVLSGIQNGLLQDYLTLSIMGGVLVILLVVLR